MPTTTTKKAANNGSDRRKTTILPLFRRVASAKFLLIARRHGRLGGVTGWGKTPPPPQESLKPLLTANNVYFIWGVTGVTGCNDIYATVCMRICARPPTIWVDPVTPVTPNITNYCRKTPQNTKWCVLQR